MNNKFTNGLINELKTNNAKIEKWEYLDALESIAIKTQKSNLYDEFLQRYYYTPLLAIFKEDDITKTFKPVIEYRKGNDGYTLYFSKNAFLRNVIENIDDLYEENGDKIYPTIKNAIRLKRDVYRDVKANGTNSLYYDFALKEYKGRERNVRFNEYIKICQKKCTHFLKGYLPLLDFLDKGLKIEDFVKCFNAEQLYLLTCISIVENNIQNSEIIDKYIEIINEIRQTQEYNCHIVINNQKYTVDDLISKYQK